jgi:hypothetical protein
VISWLEDNLIGRVLAGFCAAMVLALLILVVIWTLPPAGSEADESAEQTAVSLDVPRLKAGEPIEQYAVITERPVFSESRQPEIALDVGDDDMEDLVETDVDAPEVELAGVVITPSVRVATLRPKEGDESLLAFEGKPLEGDYGSWQVSRIEPRRVTLRSGSGEEVQLELQVHDMVIQEPPKPVVEEKKPESTAGGEQDDEDEPPMTRAEEIRQRIAERREELRRAAEEDQSPESAKPADYSSAIQSMLKRKPNQADDENEQ